MSLTMDAVKINAKDFIDESKPVIDAANAIGAKAAAQLRAGGSVIVSVLGVRGVSSSFFNVILSAVAPILHNDFSDERFVVETETKTQSMILKRSIDALSPRAAD